MSISEIDPMTGGAWVKWTPAKLRKFKRAFSQAILKHNSTEASFFFEGHEFLISFSAYLIDHLNNQFGIKDKNKK